MYEGCASCEDRDSSSKQKSSSLVVVVMMGKWGCAGGGDAGLRIFELSAPWRIGDLRGGGEEWGGGGGGGDFLGPLGCLWSRTHLSLRESAEETLESDIHPPSTPSILEMLCMTATATQPAGSPLSPSLSLSLSLPLPRGEYQCRSAFGRYTYNTYILQWNPSITDPLQGERRQ